MSKRRSVMLRLLFSSLVLSAALGSSIAEAVNVTVFAAASLKEALDEQARVFEARNGDKVVISYAASNALARQIEAGAGADIFVSADLDWMNYLDERKLIAPGTRVNLLRNTLVLVAPADSKSTLRIAPKFDLDGALGRDKLAMANPDSVPAGKYGRSALEALGVWTRRRAEGRAGRQRARGARARITRRGAVRHRLRDRRARRQGRSDRRHLSGRHAPADPLSRGDRGGESIAGSAAAARLPAFALRARRLAATWIRNCAIAHDGTYAR